MLFKALFYNYFKNNKSQVLIFYFILSIVNLLNSIVLSRLFGNLVDSINKSKNKLDSIYDIYNNILKGNIAGIILLICMLYIVIFFFYLTKNFLEATIIPDYFTYIRNTIFKSYINIYSNDYKDVKTGEVLSKIFETCWSCITLFQNSANYFIPVGSALIGIIIYFYFINPIIGTVFLLGLIIIICIYIYNYKYNLKLINIMFDNFYDNNEKINDKLSNLLNIYINNEQENETKKLIIDELRFRKNYTNRYWFEKRLTSLSDLVILLVTILILIVSYNLYSTKKINTISFISVIAIIGTAMDYLYAVNGELSATIYHYGVIKSNKKLLHHILKNNNRDVKDVVLEKGSIEFVNVTFGYNNKNKIFNKFNYKIKAGEKVAIIGQSGSGKTTIMKLLIDLHDIQNGEILVDNYNIKNIKTNYLRSKIVYINQRTVLFNRSILDNMIYGTEKNKNDVINLLNKYDLMVIFNKLPNSIYSNAGVNGNNLSLGMQKITMIIRGILRDGIIYGFDEPLTSLDSKTRVKVIKMLINELKNKTLIIITHDKEILPYMNRTLKMNKIKN